MIKLPTFLSLALISFLSFQLQGQTSPIKWNNNSFNINVDTTAYNKAGGKRFSSIYYSLDANYTFKNVGEHVTFLDTSAFYKQYIAKPGESATISLVSNHVFNLYSAILEKRDTTTFVLLPFYYEGKTYREKLACELTFGKSKLIQYDSLFFDATARVGNFVTADTISEYPSLRLKYYFTIKNTTKKPILCTKEFVAWNDSQALRNNDNYVEVLPGETYKIPAQLNMDRKYRFTCAGTIEVFSEGIHEIFPCEIKSSYQVIKH